MMPVTGTREMSTKPVTTVPTIAPTVAIPESRPTTVPVSSRVVSISLVTMGVTAASSAPGTTIDTAATITRRLPDSSTSPAARTTNGVAATATPDIESRGAMVRRGGTTSAARPPYIAPSAIAVSAVPMTSVLVSSVRPR